MSSQFLIQKPIWNGGERCVGLAEGRIGYGPTTTFEILYRNKEGKRIYPHQFVVGTHAAMTCPVQMVKGMRLRVVPLSICQEVPL